MSKCCRLLSPKLWGATFVVVAFFLVCFVCFRHLSPQMVYAYFFDLVKGHPLEGALLFFLLQVFVVLCGVVPASVLVVGAGVVFGAEEGFYLAAASVLVGSIIAFLLSRSLLSKHILQFVGKYRLFNALKQAADQKGWKVVCLLRLSPVLPFAVTSYAMGFTSISLKDYTLGTLCALPPLFGYVLIGALTQDSLAHAMNGDIVWLKYGLNGISIIATIILTWCSGKVVCNYMQREKY